MIRFRMIEPEEEVNVTEVGDEFFTNEGGGPKMDNQEIPGPNLQAVTEALFDNCEDYQNLQNMKNLPIWRPY